MKKRNLIRKSIGACALAFCLCFSGCGAETSYEQTENASGPGSVEVSGQPVTSASDAVSISDQTVMSSASEEHPSDGSGREVITLGTCKRIQGWEQIGKAVTAFNQSQDQYVLELKQYDDISQFNLDIVRKQGCDLFDLSDGRIGADVYAVKGVLEDLTPYFESSDVVGRDDIVDAVWRAGSIEEKLFFLIPAFRCRGVLVEKEYTADGAWTGADYLALADRYPESMLNKDVQSPTAQIFTYLSQWVGNYIDWEKRTCSFDSQEFIALLETLKELSERSYKAPENSDAESVRNKTYLTYAVTLGVTYQLNDYKDLKDTFFDICTFAGMPSADGTLSYDMYYEQLYGMNAASENKEGAWAFLEYLLSEEYQQPVSPDTEGLHDTSLIAGCFPSRKDMLERTLQENLEYTPEPDGQKRGSANIYTKEITYEYRRFLQEDKEFILRMIDNSYREAFITDQIPLNLIKEESEPFFEGQKSAADVAKIIQSRVSLYLSE